MIVAATVGVGILLVAMAIRSRAEPVVEQPEVALEGRSSDRGHAWNLRGSGDLVSDLTCVEFVELVTAFLDGALDPITERRLVDHLPNCVGCERYLDQFRQTIHTLGDRPPVASPNNETGCRRLGQLLERIAVTLSALGAPGTLRTANCRLGLGRRAGSSGDPVGQALLWIRAATPSKIRLRPNCKSS